MQPANIADIYFHSLWQNPLHKGKKTHTIVFIGQKFRLWLVIGKMLIFHLWENHLTYPNLHSFLQINFLLKFSLEKISVR